MAIPRALTVTRLGTIDYAAALALQAALVQARWRDAIGDTLLLLEHPAVYTLGRGADDQFLIDPPPHVPIHRVSRGGQVTYHGPGQLIGYPILKLEGADRDVIRYLRKLEQVMIYALGHYSIDARQREGLTGVWVGTQKIASIGIGLRRWTTLHGFALNVSTDLRYFERIVPCGIAGCQMTSITALGQPDISVTNFADVLEQAFAAVFAYAKIVEGDPRELWRLADAALSSVTSQG